MRLASLDLSALRFRTSAEAFGPLRAACEANPDLALFETIGTSEEGRPIAGVTLGYGPRTVTLMAGAHADEPVGPETLRTLILKGLAARDWDAPEGGLHSLFERFTFRIIPHVNSDAEARNQAWIEAWPDLGAFLQDRRREPPGRDVEFGFPAMRPENEAAVRFLFDGTPLALHASLHGMAFSEGALVLVERSWMARAEGFVARFRGLAAEAGLRLHDHDRGGDKGFVYGGPGEWSTPEGAAMQAHFRALGDESMARAFHLSSMEWAQRVGRDPQTGEVPLCIVTELPLFQLAADYEHEPGVAALSERLRAELPALTEAAHEASQASAEPATEASGEPSALDALAAPYGIRPLGLRTAVQLHLATLDAALDLVG